MLPEPEGWAADEVSGFLKAAYENSFATFAKVPNYFTRAIAVDSLYRRVSGRFGKPDNWLLGLFVLRAHGAFLGSLRAAASGQVPEGYMCMRGCLEAVLYAAHIEADVSRARTWIDRDDGDEQRRACRGEFTAGRAFKSLEAQDKRLCGVIRTLYDRTIDLGAHPNAASILGNLSVTDREAGLELKLDYLSGGTPAFELCLKSTLQVAVATLEVFERLAPQTFSGSEDDLKSVREGL